MSHLTSDPQPASAHLPQVGQIPVAEVLSEPDPDDALTLAVPQYLDEAQLHSPRRRLRTPVLLFLTTCCTTYAAGAINWSYLGLMAFDSQMLQQLIHGWRTGLAYMFSVLSVLMAHEMGHYLMMRRYGVLSSYPLFIPVPQTLSGTMGAVIVMDGTGRGTRADRKQLFDIGIAGPLAGLVVTIPLIIAGLTMAPVVEKVVQQPTSANADEMHFGDPLLVKLLIPVLRPELKLNQELGVNALYMAGWVGLLITGLNMLPISQLDGGHVAFAVFGRGSRWISRGMLLTALLFIIFAEQYNWTVMMVLVVLMGIQHPPTADDQAYMSPARRILGAASLAIPIFCFTPYPLY